MKEFLVSIPNTLPSPTVNPQTCSKSVYIPYPVNFRLHKALETLTISLLQMESLLHVYIAGESGILY